MAERLKTQGKETKMHVCRLCKVEFIVPVDGNGFPIRQKCPACTTKEKRKNIGHGLKGFY